MKKFNTNSVFFRLALLFIITLIVIVSLIVITFHYFNDPPPYEKAFSTPISHIQKIMEDIEAGMNLFQQKDISKNKRGRYGPASKKHHWKSFRRFTVSVFKGEKNVFSDKEHDFTLSEFLKESKKTTGADNIVTYKGDSFIIFKNGEVTKILGNKRRRPRKGFRFRRIFLQLGFPVFLILLILYFFIRKLLVPVNTLLPALNEIRRGNFDYQIDVKTNDEFQSIIESFNDMASQINVMFQNNLLLIGNISHDLKYYLTRMKMQVEIEIENAESKDSFNEDIDKMTEYIDRTVEVYQANANKTRYKIEQINISKMIKEKYENADINIEILDDNIMINTDENYFSLILDNLYDNGIKYGISDNSTSVIKLTLKKMLKSFELIIENKTEFKLHSNEMNLLFQPFYRKDTSRSQDIQGTGLGLFIVKQISDSLGLDTKLSIEDENIFKVIISGSVLS